MDKIEEIKKLKQLYDDGIITNEEFSIQKQKILGISMEEKKKDDNSVNNFNAETDNLDEYENDLLKQINEKKEKNINNNKKEEDDFYKKEKLKEKAKLEAQEEVREKQNEIRNEKIKKNLNKGKNFTAKVIKWILAVFCWIMGLGSFLATGNGILYIPAGIMLIVLGFLSCPAITRLTTKNQVYTQYKKWIVSFLIVILFILLCSM